jgi:asparagine synthase (glutamine-hydrolysing)
VLVHERLAIVGVGQYNVSILLKIKSYFPPLESGAQPLTSEDEKIILCVNGEIYNHIALRSEFGPDVKFKTHSDCEIIIPLVSSNKISYLRLIQNFIFPSSTKNTIRTCAKN